MKFHHVSFGEVDEFDSWRSFLSPHRCDTISTSKDLEGVARTVRAPCKVPKYAFSWALFFPRAQAQRHQVMVRWAALEQQTTTTTQVTTKTHQEVPKIPLQGRKKERQKETPGIIQWPLATIHNYVGTPAILVCREPLHRVKSERCCTVRAPCDNTLLERAKMVEN